MRLEKEIDLLYCLECDEEIDQLEAYQHSFHINGVLNYFHKNCCPVVLEGQKCKSQHKGK